MKRSTIIFGSIFSLLTVAATGSRLGPWRPDERCVDPAGSPVDVVWLIDDIMLFDDLKPAVRNKPVVADRRHGFVRHNLRAFCAPDDFFGFVIDEETLCPQRTDMMYSDEEYAEAVGDLWRKLGGHPDIDGPSLLDDSSRGLMAAVSTAWRPNSTRIIMMYTTMGPRFGTESKHPCEVGRIRYEATYYTPYCMETYVPSMMIVIYHLMRTQVALVLYLEAMPDDEKLNWQNLYVAALLVGLPIMYDDAAYAKGFVNTAWNDMELMTSRLQCRDGEGPIGNIGPLTSASLATTDKIPSGQKGDVNMVLLIDDQYGSAELLGEVPDDYPYTLVQGFRFNRVMGSCDSSGDRLEQDYNRCARPVAIGDMAKFGSLDDMWATLSPTVLFDPTNFSRAQDLVNAMYGAMLYSINNGARRVVVIYTRLYPGAPLFDHGCNNLSGKNEFNLLCTREGNGDFGQAWSEIIEKGTYVLIVMARIDDPKLSGETDPTVWKNGWEEAIANVKTVNSDGRVYLTNESTLAAGLDYFNKVFLHE